MFMESLTIGPELENSQGQKGGADRATDASGVTLTPDVLGAVRPLLLRADFVVDVLGEQ
jgi:hypothetical protein